MTGSSRTKLFGISAIAFMAGIISFPIIINAYERSWIEQCQNPTSFQTLSSKSYSRLFFSSFELEHGEIAPFFRNLGSFDRFGNGLKGIYLKFNLRLASSIIVEPPELTRVVAIDLANGKHADCNIAYQTLMHISPEIATEFIAAVYYNSLLSPDGKCPQVELLPDFPQGISAGIIQRISGKSSSFTTFDYRIKDSVTEFEVLRFTVKDYRHNWLDKWLHEIAPETIFISFDCGSFLYNRKIVDYNLTRDVVDLITGRNGP